MTTPPVARFTPWTAARVDEQTRRHFDRFTRDAADLRARNAARSAAESDGLRLRFGPPVFGLIPNWSLIEMMAQVIDPADDRLYCTSQATHILQVIDALTANGLTGEEFILAALLHDVGKVALLKADPAQTPSYTAGLLAAGTPGAGLDRCALRWSCDELAWSRLQDHLPPAVAWLIRYHSINPEECAPFMDARDRDYAARYLAPFRECDIYSKSPFARPRRRLEDFRPLIEKYLPPRLVF